MKNKSLNSPRFRSSPKREKKSNKTTLRKKDQITETHNDNTYNNNNK